MILNFSAFGKRDYHYSYMKNEDLCDVAQSFYGVREKKGAVYEQIILRNEFGRAGVRTY